MILITKAGVFNFLAFFKIIGEIKKGKKIDHTSLGDMYHVVFLTQGEDGQPELDDHFEAIFAHPETYVRNLVGADVFGCFVRKTENSWKWVDDYLRKTLARVTILKMKNYASSIANT